MYGTLPDAWAFSPHRGAQGKANFFHRSCFAASKAAPKAPAYPSTPPPPPPPPPAPIYTPAASKLDPAKQWHDFILRVRKIVDSHQLPISASPRVTIEGAKIIADGNGATLEDILNGKLWEGLSDEIIGAAKNEVAALSFKLPQVTPKARAMHVLDIDTSGLHNQAKTILTRLKQGMYPFLHGAPGAGKTTLCQQIADRSKLEFLLIPCSQDMLRSEILGTKNPLTGDYYASKFFELWTNGGLILFDECGLAPGVFLNLLNAAMANKEITFPNGQRVTKHPNCFIVFADNSNLWGTDARFPERQDAGSAFRNRLFYIRFEYDTTLEGEIVSSILKSE